MPDTLAPKFGDIKAVCNDVDGLVKQWIKAWTTQDFGNYINKYSPTFTQPGMTRDTWFDLRQKRVTYPQAGIALSVSNIRVQQTGNVMRATFDQIYDNKTYTDVVEKNLTFDNVGGKCLITEESVNKGRLY
jgi:murein L,D-transpeptidase YafK